MKRHSGIHPVKPHSKVRLAHIDPGRLGSLTTREASLPVLVQRREEIARLQEIFYASQQHALLIILEGMDTAGKDGTISHIFENVNPQGCDVTSFKVPTPLEARHDFLWRAHAAVPPLGMIGIFNRSHYEDVLSPRVHKHITAKTVRQRFKDILAFERSLADNGVTILKFFLHISHAEQTRRLQERIDTPGKQWKLSAADFAEREFWDEYQTAYDDLLSATSRKYAPWFVVPADHKWHRNVAISEILVETMRGLKLKYPPPTLDPTTIKL